MTKKVEGLKEFYKYFYYEERDKQQKWIILPKQINLLIAK